MNDRYPRKHLCLLLTALACLFAALPAVAVEIHPNAGTTSAAFLKLGAGSRAVALGSAFGGLSDDISALYWNPAGLAQLQRQEFQVYHNESFESIRNDFVAFGMPYRKGVIAAGITALYTPKDLERRSGFNEADPYEPLSPIEGFFQAYDIAAHVGYGRWFRDNLAGGVGIKLLQQTIDDRSGYGVGADLGILYRSRRLPLSSGLVIQNIGTPVKFISKSYPLPMNFKLGAAWRWNRSLVTTFDLNKPIDNFLFISAGTEYLPVNLLSLRVGYRYRLNGLELGDLSGLSAGLGFNFHLQNTDLRFDYAFIPFGVLGNSHRLSVGILFGDSHGTVPSIRTQEAAKAKQDYGIRTEAPALPQNTHAAVVYENDDGYSFHHVQLSGKRRMVTGRRAIHQIRGVIDGGALLEFSGTVKMLTIQGLEIDAGEKPGEGNVYRRIIFKKNFTDRIQNVLCTIKVPADFGTVVIRTDDGKSPGVRKTGNDVYQFTIDSLVPFSIEK